jgi:hypothetical protein
MNWSQYLPGPQLVWGMLNQLQLLMGPRSVGVDASPTTAVNQGKHNSSHWGLHDDAMAQHEPAPAADGTIMRLSASRGIT